ncbi:MAG: acyltransferase [Gammaproteobacteria bacterium]|jgi:peptidoglycan/LPS O-acetylase OafA/YrhL|nr:hypothetical protein [Chromatiales bacterium]MDP6675307.1 acyltransferase [Gammaproteobacteria bacterium]
MNKAIVGQPTSEIAPLTGIRGFAALWLVLYHLFPLFRQEFPGADLAQNFVRFGYLAVDLFAILSGFIIAYTYCDRLKHPSFKEMRRYLWFRFARTYPTHFFVLCLFVMVMIYDQGWNALVLLSGDPAFLRQLFLLNGVGFEDQWAWNAPTWSLSSEWVCYLLFPVFAPLLMRIRSGRVACVLAVAVLAVIGWGMNRASFPMFAAVLGGPPLLRITGAFAIGCLLYRVHAAGLFRNLPMGWIGLYAFLGTMGMILYATDIGLINRFSFVMFAPSIIVGFAVLVLALADSTEGVAWFFAYPLVAYLGKISYSVYLFHWLIITRIQLDVWLGVPQGWQTMVRLGTVIAVSVLAYHLIERPSRNGLRRIRLT